MLLVQFLCYNIHNPDDDLDGGDRGIKTITTLIFKNAKIWHKQQPYMLLKIKNIKKHDGGYYMFPI